MNFITTTEAAKKWGISKDRVLKLAKSHRIPDVVQIGTRWMIPSDASKPIDNRYKKNKQNNNVNVDPFRYLTYEGLNLKNINPPLTKIEKQITRLSEKVFACEFVEAEEILKKLLKEKLNSFEYNTVLRAGCYIYIYLNKKNEFFKYYEKIAQRLKEDSPRKEELSIILMEINLTVGFDNDSIREFNIKPEYRYHESFMSHLASVCTISLNFSSTDRLSEHDLMPYEYLCSFYENKRCYVDLQTMHYYLGITYGLMNINDKMIFHIKKVLDIANKYNLYYTPAASYFYVKKMIDPILDSYPNKFVTKFRRISNYLLKQYIKFTKSISLDIVNTKLNSSDHIFVYYAVHHYSNKEIANILNISERNVAKRYSVIYETLGINTKQELIDYYNNQNTK